MPHLALTLALLTTDEGRDYARATLGLAMHRSMTSGVNCSISIGGCQDGGLRATIQ